VHDCLKLCELWHKRFGSLHYGTLPFLKEMVQGLLNFKIEKTRVCKDCTLDEHAKTTFQSSEHRSRGILDLIHSNVCGPITSTSLTCNIYYVSLIDDSFLKSWIYFMNTKDEVLMETQTSKKIKVLRFCNGEEHTSKEFDVLCMEAGI